MIGAIYDVLPSPQNLNQWLGEDAACPLCSCVCTLSHILTGCRVSLSQGRYTWRHNQVLKCLEAAIEEKRIEANTSTARNENRHIMFVHQGDKARVARYRAAKGVQGLGAAGRCKWRTDSSTTDCRDAQKAGPAVVVRERKDSVFC